MSEPKIMRIDQAIATPMRRDRGVAHRLVGPMDGAANLDVHINVITQDSGIGPYHYHKHAENVYVIVEGIAQAVVDGTKYLLAKDDVAFIPPGTLHAAGSAGYGTLTMIEIYAPAGEDFHIVGDPPRSKLSRRVEIEHLLPPNYLDDFA